MADRTPAEQALARSYTTGDGSTRFAVTELSVARVVSLMMGAWFLATAYSEVLAAQFGKLAAIEIPQDGTLDLLDAAGRYAELFQLMAGVGLGAAVVALLAAPLIQRGMHGVK